MCRTRLVDTRLSGLESGKAKIDRNLPLSRDLKCARQRATCNMCFDFALTKLPGFINALAVLLATITYFSVRRRSLRLTRKLRKRRPLPGRSKPRPNL